MVFLLKNLRVDVISFIGFLIAVKYEARLEDGMLVSKSDGVEFTVQDGIFCIRFKLCCSDSSKTSMYACWILQT